MNEHSRRIPEAELPTEERRIDDFQSGDLVYIDLRADHEYRGHSGVFVGYTETGIGDTQCWARVMIAKALIEVRAEALSFAPEPEIAEGDGLAPESPVSKEFEHLRTGTSTDSVWSCTIR